MQRPSWDEHFIELAITNSKRSNCIRRKVGAIVVKNNRVISAGFNGTPSGIKNCFEGGCERCNNSNIPSGTRLDECICLHAETNALLECGREKAYQSTIYITHIPCLECTKKIVQVGRKEIVYNQDYPNPNNLAQDLLKASQINVRKLVRN